MSKILIYGYSKLAVELADLLKDKNYKFVIASNNKKNLQNTIDKGFEAHESDLSIDKNLIDIGIGKDINVFFCMSENIHDNLFVTLSARALDKNLKIISHASSKQDETKMLLSGANGVINPYEIGTQRLFRLMRKPTLFWVLDMLLFGSSNIIFSELRIDDSRFINMALKNLENTIGANIIVIGLQRHDKFIYDTRRSSYHIKKDDIIVIIGDKKEVQKLKGTIK